MAISPTGTNVACVGLVFLGSILTFQIVMRASVIRVAPLAALSVLGFNVATLSGSLLAQTASWRALDFNLRVPVVTFAAAALFQTSLLIAISFYTSSHTIRGFSASFNRLVCRPLGLMNIPSPTQLWAMGAVGSAALAWTTLTLYSGEIQYGDVGAKFLFGVTVLAYAPYLIPIIPLLVGGQDVVTVPRRTTLLVTGYTLLLLVLGVAQNSRSTFSLGIANLLMAICLATLLGQLRLSKRARRGALIAAAAVLLFGSPLSDLAIAMVVTRGDRGNVQPRELITQTIAAFKDKESLEAYRAVAAAGIGQADYEENYIANPFLARFIQTKFFDNTLSLTEVRSGHHAKEAWDVTVDKIVAALPTPVLRALGYKLDKATLEYSMGDYLYYLEYGNGLGGHRVGSPVAHGLALFGPSAYLAVIPFFLLVFTLLGAFTSRDGEFIVISPIILVQLMTIYFLACGDSLLDPVGFIIRGLPQTILIYLVVLHATKPLTRLKRGRSVFPFTALSHPRVNPRFSATADVHNDSTSLMASRIRDRKL